MGQTEVTYLLLIGPEAAASLLWYNVFTVALLNLTLHIAPTHRPLSVHRGHAECRATAVCSGRTPL